jgi:nitrate reductase NapD
MSKARRSHNDQIDIDRRAFISGRMIDTNRVITPPDAEIASVLVQARPERLGAVEAAIVALAGCKIFGRDPRGKLVVVIETSNASSIGSTLNTIALLPDVFTASLVFHAIDAG